MERKETLEEANWKVLGTKDDTFFNGTKWQQKNSYSDEEVFELCKQFATFIQQKRPSYKKQQEWFEQSKKKYSFQKKNLEKKNSVIIVDYLHLLHI
jgi:hypothetical protein